MRRFFSPLWFIGTLLSLALAIWLAWLVSPPDWSKGGLEPGTPEYKYYHGDSVDTIPTQSNESEKPK